jgi:hypothetical protein
VTLAADNDFIQLSVTFVPKGILYTSNGTSASLGIGLYNSHGVGPIAGGALNGISPNVTLGSGTEYPTGGAQLWDGYTTKLRLANAEMYTRPAQTTSTTNASQDLILRNGVTGGFNSPVASLLPNSATGLQLTDSSTYTYTFKISVTPGGVGTLDLAQNIYAGTDTSMPALFTHTGTTTVAQTIATAFDGLAMGYRATNDSTAPTTEHSLNISQIKVETNVALPTEDANFNNDSVVDGSDYMIWQQGLGTGTTNATGDANGSGAVDGADLTVLRAHWGLAQGVAAAGSVPEPSTGVLCAILAGSVLIRRGKKK